MVWAKWEPASAVPEMPYPSASQTSQSVSQLLLSAVLLNTIFSVLAPWVLYELDCVVLQCRRQAFLSAILFCITPANVFMTAAYSESMFALLAFGAMWQLEKRHLWTSTLLFSLASGVHSNGMINAGFLIYAQT
ncbi:UNVERIFIED_CONTAM: hypothetical protein K2H54_051723 [Gekko kuhli]